jgi:hypothetical protein
VDGFQRFSGFPRFLRIQPQPMQQRRAQLLVNDQAVDVYATMKPMGFRGRRAAPRQGGERLSVRLAASCI